MMYMSLEAHYRLTHRLSSTHYSITDIDQMAPYERDMYLALVYEDANKNKEAHQAPI